MNHENAISSMKGPYSAIFTPFNAHNEINLEMLGSLIEFQLENGIQGFFVAGSTGEGLLLSFEERVAVIQHAAERVADRGTVIAHVGHPSTDVAAKLAKESAKAGVDWIASTAPIFHGSTFDGACRHYKQISNATDLPFMIYSLGAAVDPNRDARLFELPNVCGLKYTGANFFSVQQMARQLDEPVALMSGFDEQFVAGQSFGFSGGIGTTFNFAPRIYADIYHHYHKGDIAEAARLQERINRVTYLMVSFENWSYRKAIMKYIGFDCGPARAPYAPLTDQEYDEFAAQLRELDVLPPGDPAV